MDIGSSVVVTCSLEDLVAICIDKEDAECILNDVGIVKNVLYDGDSIDVYFPKVSCAYGSYWFEPNMLKVV